MPAPSFTLVRPFREPPPHARSAVAPPVPCASTDAAQARRGELSTTLGLRHGGPHPVRLRWETLGDPSLPPVVVLGGISADRHVARSGAFPEPGWWDAQVGAGRPIDPAHHHVVAIDWVGADGSIDVPIDTSDQADAVITTLEHLGITTLAAFVGCSYGALVGLQLAVRHRRRLGHLIAISGTSRPHPYAAAYRAIQREVVTPRRSPLTAGRPRWRLARQLGMLSYRTPAEFGQSLPRTDRADRRPGPMCAAAVPRSTRRARTRPDGRRPRSSGCPSRSTSTRSIPARSGSRARWPP